MLRPAIMFAPIRQQAARTFSVARAVRYSSSDSKSTVLDKVAEVFREQSHAPAHETSIGKRPAAEIEAGFSDLSTQERYRPFMNTTVIRPHEFHPNARRWRDKQWPSTPNVGPAYKDAVTLDAFHQLELDPMDFAATPTVLNKFMTTMGKIEPRFVTNLTRKNQRRLGKAIRRSRMMGIIPSFSLRKKHIANPAALGFAEYQ
ncbi:hypothetical protein CYLTODRAFT_396143 [Cylindrobasidium torrendii FP15055 ss-10]|uniref:Small ribosomal subunit protein bS18m n=1 Tax=Cylindrobasidium torrendii FP15055 ss-10 TaxID=1314674 RepID=A0A0D7BBM9_9AGAR|nr:hypothetical protein CYLTODRAFT_396143 [Cylindrobasidium torrendii FP15055 ss-10]